jgi:predicted permease
MPEWKPEILRRLAPLRLSPAREGEIAEEIAQHLDERYQELLAAGHSADSAFRAALDELKGEGLLARNLSPVESDLYREPIAFGKGSSSLFAGILQDIHYAFRMMRKSPGFTAVAVLTLALGIGANTAIFSLMDRLMLRSLPVQDPSQLVLFEDGLDEGISDRFPNPWLYSYPFFREMQKRNQVFSEVAAAFSMIDNAHGFVEGRSESEAFQVQMVSGSYFPMLGVQALLGRTLNEHDDNSKGGHPVAVVSYAWWTRALGRDPSVLGKKLTLGSTVFSIVGVTPPEFFGTKVGTLPDLWVSLSMQSEIPPGFDGYNDQMSESLHLMARVKPGVTLPEATANANLLFQQILRGFSTTPLTRENLLELDKTHLELTPMATGFSSLRYRFSGSLKVLMAVVCLVLLIACANIANLLLARSTARARELAVRQALGAVRSRLIRQLLTESLVLALAGGTVGMVFASTASHLIVSIVSDGRAALNLDAGLDLRLLIFTFAVAIATALLVGTIPAFRATRLNVSDSLKGGRNQSGAAAKGPFAKALIVSQVALSLVLLIGSGLFVRSLMNLVNVDTGFNRENVVRMTLDASSAGYKEDERLAGMFRQVEERVTALPGVRAASFSVFSFNEGTWNNCIWVQSYMHDCPTDVQHNAVGRGFFSAMGIPLLAGRTFGPQDSATSQKVGIINETAARLFFPAGSPIGLHYGRTKDHAGDIEVIGVVKDVKYNSLDEKPLPGDYLPYTQNVRYLNEFEVRYAGDTASVIGAVRQTIHQVDSTLPISDVSTLNQQVERSIANQRLLAQLSAFFGLLAVFLSCIGIYGLMSYVVTRRVNEIGLRMALGAERSHVMWLVMRESLWLVALGIATGAPVALASDRLISSMLFGLRATDAVSLLVAVGLLLAVAAIAGYLPARRASLIDPMVALRSD